MLKNRIEYIGFLFLAGLFRILGINLSRILARLLGSFFYYLVPIRKATVISNLKTAFPEKSESEIKSLTKLAYRNFSLTFAEMLLLHYITAKEFSRMIDHSEAEEVLAPYFESGKSFFLLSGHFGNWELFTTFPHHYKKAVNAMAKPMRNVYVSKWINQSREKFGTNVVLLGSSIRELYKVLKDNGVILSVGDQRGPSDGVRVNFFNKSTAAFNGTAVLALKTGSPIIMTFIVRQKNFDYKVRAKELRFDDLTGTEEEKIAAICQRFFSYLESMIREYPDQWFWMHKIWKY